MDPTGLARLEPFVIAAGLYALKNSKKIYKWFNKKPTCKSTDPLVEAGKEIDKAQLTKAGRALQKHGDRADSAFPKSKGNHNARNQFGQEVLENILKSKNQMTKQNRFGGIDFFDKATGRGVRFDGKGNMMGFLEP